jgi:hypothetical protein
LHTFPSSTPSSAITLFLIPFSTRGSILLTAFAESVVIAVAEMWDSSSPAPSFAAPPSTSLLRRLSGNQREEVDLSQYGLNPTAIATMKNSRAIESNGNTRLLYSNEPSKSLVWVGLPFRALYASSAILSRSTQRGDSLHQLSETIHTCLTATKWYQSRSNRLKRAFGAALRVYCPRRSPAHGANNFKS